MPANVGAKFANGPLYTVTHVGYRQTDGVDRFAPGLKVGGQLPLEPAFVAIDLGYETELAVDSADVHAEDVVRYRGLVGVDIAPPLSVFVGAGVRQRLPTDENSLEHDPDLFAGVELF
jgi:hypothetical protein